MSLKKVAAVQMNSTDNVEQNIMQAAFYIEQATKQGAELVVLPEMFVYIGKKPEIISAIAETDGIGPIQDFLSNIARKHGCWLVSGTIPILSNIPEKTYASTLVFNDQGCRVARYDKQHLFDVAVDPSKEVYQESKFTIPGNHSVVIDSPFGRLGVAVCYDLRFPTVFLAMAEQACEIIAVPAAFTVPTGTAHWETLVRARALDTFSYLIAADQTGLHLNGRRTYGHSMIVGPWGNVLKATMSKPGIIVHQIDHQITHAIRQRFGQ